jgi:hypothetical protein
MDTYASSVLNLLTMSAAGVCVASVVLGSLLYRAWPAERSGRSRGIRPGPERKPYLYEEFVRICELRVDNVRVYQLLRWRGLVRLLMLFLVFSGLVAITHRPWPQICLGVFGAPILIAGALGTRRVIVEHVRLRLEMKDLLVANRERIEAEERIEKARAYAESPAGRLQVELRKAEEEAFRLAGICPSCRGSGRGSQYSGTVGGNAIHGVSHAFHPCPVCNGSGRF